MDMSALYAMLGIRPSTPPAPAYSWTMDIMALPTEILVSLFQLACEADAEEDINPKSNRLATTTTALAARPLPRSIALSHVCSRWRTIVLDTPRLWAKVKVIVRHVSPFSDRQRQFLEMWTSRSQSVPLDIHVFLSCEFEKAHEDEEALPVLEAIAQLATRHKCLPPDAIGRKVMAAEPMLESGLDVAASTAQEWYSLYYLHTSDPETRAKLLRSLSPLESDNDDWDRQKSAYSVRIEGHRQRARPDEVGLPGLVRNRYGPLQASLTTLNLRGGAGGRQTQTLSAEDLLILLRDFQRLRHVQAHVTHQHDNQRLHVPGTPSMLPLTPLAHHAAQGAHDAPNNGEGPAAAAAEHANHHQHQDNQLQQQQQQAQNHPNPDLDDEIVTAPHLQHLDLSWDAVANAGLVLRALQAPALQQLALRRRGASPFWLGHWEHLLHFLERSSSAPPPLQALVLHNLDCTTLRLGACLALCSGTLEGLAMDACAFDESEMRGVREGVGRCTQFKMLSVVDCPGLTKGWCEGMRKVMMRRGVETNIRMLEPKKLNNTLGVW